jgi:hypothetical protein
MVLFPCMLAHVLNTFSEMKYVKSMYRSSLSDMHLKSPLMIGSLNLEPRVG